MTKEFLVRVKNFRKSSVESSREIHRKVLPSVELKGAHECKT